MALEPLPFGLVASMPQGAELIRAVGHPAAGLLVDFWHVFRAGTSLPELIELSGSDVRFGIELCDARTQVVGTLFEDTRDRRTLVGQGDQDVLGFIGAIREIGYTGPWGVEILSVGTPSTSPYGGVEGRLRHQLQLSRPLTPRSIRDGR